MSRSSLTYSLLILFIGVFLLQSCGNGLDIQKRKYRDGFYVEHNLFSQQGRPEKQLSDSQITRIFDRQWREDTVSDQIQTFSSDTDQIDNKPTADFSTPVEETDHSSPPSGGSPPFMGNINPPSYSVGPLASVGLTQQAFDNEDEPDNDKRWPVALIVALVAFIIMSGFLAWWLWGAATAVSSPPAIGTFVFMGIFITALIIGIIQSTANPHIYKAFGLPNLTNCIWGCITDLIIELIASLVFVLLLALIQFLKNA